MTSEYQRELLKISKFDLWRIHKTLFETLHDDGYLVNSPRLTMSFDQFCAHIDELKHQNLVQILSSRTTSESKPCPTGKSNVKKTKTNNRAMLRDRKLEMEQKKFPAQVIESELKDLERDQTEIKVSKVSKTSIKKKAASSSAVSATNGGLGAAFETCLTLDATRTGPSMSVEKLVVLFGKEKILGVVAITELSRYLKQAALQHVILVTAQGFTAFAQGPLNKLRAQFSVCTFVHEELLVNVTRHVLVKPHTKLGEKERAELLHKYKIDNDPEQLPKLLKTDPVAAYYNFEVGDIVAVSNVGAPTNYRLVVNKMT